MRPRLLIVGGDAAGMSAAAQARRRRSPDQLEIIAFEKGEYSSYSACGLPYLVAGHVNDVNQLIARSSEQFREQGIDVRIRHEVVAIDVAARTVTVRDLGAGSERNESFDHLMVATGATPFRPPLPGADAHGVHGIQTVSDGIELRDHVQAHRHANQRAVVVGGGYIGLELAEALHQIGLPVTVVDSHAQPMSGLDPDVGALVADAMRGLGIEVRTETTVEGFDTDDRGHVRAVATDDGELPADIVVLGTGVRPNVELAGEAGIDLGETGGIKVDARMATSATGVWAAGDCVETFHRVSRRAVYVPLGTHANKQGRVAGANITGDDAEFPGVIGTAVTKICAYEIGRTGLTEREAVDAGLDHVAATIESSTRAHYFPGAHKITVKVVAERGSARILGAQIIGREGAAKRIDVLATAIWAGLTCDDLAQADLAYAPPFGPVWDPALIAARQAASRA